MQSVYELDTLGRQELQRRELLIDRPAVLRETAEKWSQVRGGREARTYALGEVTRIGRRVANVEAKAWQDDPGKPIATVFMNYRCLLHFWSRGFAPWGVPLFPATGEKLEWLMAPANLSHGVIAWTLLVSFTYGGLFTLLAASSFVYIEVLGLTPAQYGLADVAKYLSFGASPRGTLGLARMARALSCIRGRSYVDPAVVREVATPVLAHRIIVQGQGAQAKDPHDIIQAILMSQRTPQ